MVLFGTKQQFQTIIEALELYNKRPECDKIAAGMLLDRLDDIMRLQSDGKKKGCRK